jgi:hypothetical protein
MAVDGHISAGAAISRGKLELVNPHFVEDWVGDHFDYEVRSEKSGKVYRVHRTSSRPLPDEWAAAYRAKIKEWLAEQDG